MLELNRCYNMDRTARTDKGGTLNAYDPNPDYGSTDDCHNL